MIRILYATAALLAISLSAPHNPSKGFLLSLSADLNPAVIAGLAAMMLAAKLGAEVLERLGQPGVLGELMAGIVIGNLALIGFQGTEWLKTDAVVAALAQLGVILLLFEVGLDSNLGEMLEVGWSSLFVAITGVIVPFVLGWAVSAYFLPGESRLVHAFIGAVLCATSVGITARVLKDLGKLKMRESRIILGAAVIDDVIGLLVLALVVGAVNAASAGASLSPFHVLVLAAKTAIFFVVAFLAGHFVMPRLLRGAGKLESRGVLLVFSIAFCLALAWLASKLELATIVGAFAAGLVLEDIHFKSFIDRGERDLKQLLQPVTTLLVPIFFVLMGMKVDLRVFRNVEVLGFAVTLTVVAIIGKQLCSLAVAERGLNRLAIGIGMVPRGEVGLIVAGIGATLALPNAAGQIAPVVSPATFAAVVIMVSITTLLTPPLLKLTLTNKRKVRA